MCDAENLVVILMIVNRILNIIQIIAPILAIIFISIHFLKLQMNPDDKKLLKKLKNSAIALVVVFLVPTIVRTTLYLITNNSSCLEEEEKIMINSNYNPFEKVEYIELDDVKDKQKILSDPSEYEKGKPKVNDAGLTAPKNGLTISKSNAVYFLNTGASSDSFIIQDEGHFGLIDTSVSGKGSFIVSQLKKLGVNNLDFILITHAHGDHVGGYSTIMNNIPVNTLIIKTDGTNNPSHQGTYSSIIKKAQKKGTSICDAKNTTCQRFSLGNINFQLYNTGFWKGTLAPGGNHNRFENANSLVSVATINGKRIYFSGDIGNYFGYNRETEIAREVGDIDVYKVAHHGYVSFNNNQDALNYLKPEYAVVTNGRSTAFTAISRVKKSNSNFVKTYYTTNGTVTMIIDESGKINFYQ